MNTQNEATVTSTGEAKPFVKWAGGKRQLLSAIHAALPSRIERYFEPMLGAGAVYFSIQPRPSYLSDINASLIECYFCVRDSVEELIQDLEQHVFSAEYFYQLRSADREAEFSDWSPVQRASRFIYLNRTCFNGLYRVNSKGHFNVPIGRYRNPKICDPQALRIASAALQGARLSSNSFDHVLEEVKRGDFVYFDPPYAPLSSTAHFTSYTAEGFGPQQQLALAELCQSLDRKGVRFLLSNSSAASVYELYTGFQLLEVPATRNINSRSDRRGAVTELLVRNYH